MKNVHRSDGICHQLMTEAGYGIIHPHRGVGVGKGENRNYRRLFVSAAGAAACFGACLRCARSICYCPIAEGMRRDLCLSAAGALPPVFGITFIRTGIGVLVRVRYCFWTHSKR